MCFAQLFVRRIWVHADRMVDFSKTERDKVVSILRLLGTQTALDELGIGTVRDAFSDMLFPGISTLQTRAKYL